MLSWCCVCVRVRVWGVPPLSAQVQLSFWEVPHAELGVPARVRASAADADGVLLVHDVAAARASMDVIDAWRDALAPLLGPGAVAYMLVRVSEWIGSLGAAGAVCVCACVCGCAASASVACERVRVCVRARMSVCVRVCVSRGVCVPGAHPGSALAAGAQGGRGQRRGRPHGCGLRRVRARAAHTPHRITM